MLLPMTPPGMARRLAAAGLTTLVLALVLTLAACGTSGATAANGGHGGAPSPTLTPSPTPSSIPALAWIQLSGGGKPAIWGSIQGGAARQIAQIAGDDCATSAFGPPVFSPDAQTLAVVGGAGCGDTQEHGPVFVVTVATGIATPVSNADALTNERSVGWLDAQTLWWVNGDNKVYTYHLGAATSTPLPGIANAGEAAVRGTTLFVLESTIDLTTEVVRSALHVYSLTHQRDLQVIDLGGFALPTGASPGDFHFEGWDVSADGTQLVAQITTFSPGHTGITGSSIEVLHADGTGARPILRAMPTDALARLRIPPDGQLVAVTEVSSASPDVFSGCLSSQGDAGDPCLHAYTLPGNLLRAGYPVWSTDGHAFLAYSWGDNAGNGAGLYRFMVSNTTGELVQPGGVNPWGTAAD